MSIHVLLADDDPDDCNWFREALNEVPWTTKLTTVGDGEEVMQMLMYDIALPDVLFLDINMPRVDGICCLERIKKQPRLATLPVIVISTCLDDTTLTTLYTNGASYCIRKPNDFDKLKQLIDRALILITTTSSTQPNQACFVLSV